METFVNVLPDSSVNLCASLSARSSQKNYELQTIFDTLTPSISLYNSHKKI